MKYILTIIFLFAPFTEVDKIARVNKVKKEAKEAYLSGDYQTAVDKYRYLIDSLNVVDDDIRLNLANAYYNVKDTAQAISNYSDLLTSKSKPVRSTAHQQMGIISTRNKKYDEALDHFKEALRADPSNEDARYNYELMKKILKEQEQQQQDQQNQDQQQENQDKEQQNQDQQNQDQQQNQDNKDQQKQDEQQQQQNQDKEGEGEEQEKDEQQQNEQQKEEEGEQQEEQKPEPQEGEESEEKEGEQQQSLSEKLEEMKISEEKAKMILEALKNKEIQYYQQNKRKATKRRDTKKPDW